MSNKTLEYGHLSTIRINKRMFEQRICPSTDSVFILDEEGDEVLETDFSGVCTDKRTGSVIGKWHTSGDKSFWIFKYEGSKEVFHTDLSYLVNAEILFAKHYLTIKDTECQPQ